MKKYKLCATLNYISSTLFYLAALINFIWADQHSMGVMWLCLGSTFLCLGTLCAKKKNEPQDEEEKKD